MAARCMYFACWSQIKILSHTLSGSASAVHWCRYLSAQKEQREKAATFYEDLGLPQPDTKPSDIDKKELIDAVRNALYASKICSYAQVRSLPATCAISTAPACCVLLWLR